MYPLSEYRHDAEVLEGEPEHDGLELPKYSYPAQKSPRRVQYVFPFVDHADLSSELKQSGGGSDGGTGAGGGGGSIATATERYWFPLSENLAARELMAPRQSESTVLL